MDKIFIEKIGSDTSDIQKMSELMDQLESRHKIDVFSWNVPVVIPMVIFRMAANQTGLILKYYVTEPQVRAVNKEINSPVYEDSCVEFFCQGPSKIDYFNFEFNPLGTCLSQCGPSREKRTFLTREEIGKIMIWPSKENTFFSGDEKQAAWTLAICIPWETFRGHFNGNKGQTLRANFYKCGDKLDEPHYISWRRINTNLPDFHRPEFFGICEFE